MERPIFITDVLIKCCTATYPDVRVKELDARKEAAAHYGHVHFGIVVHTVARLDFNPVTIFVASYGGIRTPRATCTGTIIFELHCTLLRWLR